MEWPFYVASKVSKNHAFCKICGCDFSIAHGGRNDCRRHALSKKHNDYGKLNCQTLDKHFGIKNDDPMRAELLFTSYIIEHNLPIAAADHSKGLLQEIDPESKVAQKFTCGRTKAAALVKFLGESTEHRILAVIQQKAFALATDGSSDANDKKLYPLVVTYFNNEKGQNSTVLLSILDTADNTGKGIFTAIDGYLKRKNVPWKNCISFSCDNASTMIGNIKGVTKFITEVQPSLIVIKCACHLIHIAAKKASYQLQNFDVEQMIIQIFFYLEKRSKRKKLLKVSQNFFETKPHKILKHIGTRWLSLQQSIDRILEQWDALEHFFKSLNSEKESNSQLKNIQFMMSNPLAKLYCLFLSSSLPIFTGVNKDLQQEAPLIHKLKRKLNNLLFVLIVRFLKPCAITDSNLSDIKFEKRKNQKDDSDLVIGAKTRAYMKDVVISKSDISVFYTSVRNFYVTACNYIVKKFPLNDTFLTHAEAADIDLRKTVFHPSIILLLCSIMVLKPWMN